MDFIRLFLKNKRLLSFGFVLTFFSSFGQTFLISLYVPKIINEFQITNSFFGGLYALATVGSSFILVYVGKLIDKTDLRKYSIYSSIVLLISCLLIAFSFDIIMIFLGLLGLRFAGQGLLSHISNTTISKYFDKTRGKALSITSLGYSSGEGFFPLLMSLFIFYFGWRNSLIINSAAIGLFLIPFIWFALSNNINYGKNNEVQSASENFSRKFLFRDKRFYIIAANAVTLPFLATGLFFYQSALADYKGWSLEWLSFSFMGFAIGRTLFSLVSGQIIDKYSAVKLLPLYLLPFIIGLFLLLVSSNIYIAFIYLFLTGVSIGFGSTVKTAVIAEIYGVNNIGSIRSLFTTIMVLGTALSPFLFGLILDNGHNFSVILVFGLLMVLGIIALSTQLTSHSKYAVQLN